MSCSAVCIALMVKRHCIAVSDIALLKCFPSAFEHFDPVAVIPDSDLCVSTAFTYGTLQSSTFSKLARFLVFSPHRIQRQVKINNPRFDSGSPSTPASSCGDRSERPPAQSSGSQRPANSVRAAPYILME